MTTAPFSARDVRLRALSRGDAAWLVARHAALYASDEGFDASFGADVARVLDRLLEAPGPADRGWIPLAPDGRRLGSVLCVRRDAETAQLRLFLLEPEARGIGLGRWMLETCLDHAREAGFARMRIGTFESHRAAGRLYARTGFDCVAARAVRRYGCDLVEQTWTKALL